MPALAKRMVKSGTDEEHDVHRLELDRPGQCPRDLGVAHVSSGIAPEAQEADGLVRGGTGDAGQFQADVVRGRSAEGGRRHR